MKMNKIIDNNYHDEKYPIDKIVIKFELRNVFNELYKHRNNKELDRDIYECGFKQTIKFDNEECMFDSDSSSEEEDCSDSDSE